MSGAGWSLAEQTGEMNMSDIRMLTDSELDAVSGGDTPPLVLQPSPISKVIYAPVVAVTKAVVDTIAGIFGW
jgi:hypothetical protein